MKPLFCTILLCAVLRFCYGQNEANIWYFGYNAGLDFNSGTPVPIRNGALSTDEGCSSICDSTGKLLFYTDGVSIWNRNHATMPNGLGLGGSFTSTQSALIVKQPGNTNIYYVFCSYTAFNVVVVDMNLDHGLGDVSQNYFILSGSEKLCATKAANGKDVWIVSHVNRSNEFYSFLLSSTGFNIIPVESFAGIVDSFSYGQMKLSPQGDKIAFGIYGVPSVCVSNFNNTTGVVSNSYSITIADHTRQSYGIEFSPDGSKLYASSQVAGTTGNVYQYNLKAGDSTAVSASGVVVGNAEAVPGSLQVGPDGKIYVAPLGENFLDVIKSPNVLGTACNYVHQGIPLNGRTVQLGLPGFVSGTFHAPYGFTGSCTNENISFTTGDTSLLSSVTWNFDDPASGANNASGLFKLRHVYNTAGNYTVSLILNYKNSNIDTVSLNVPIYPNAIAGILSASRDSICANTGIRSLITATGNSDSVKWQLSTDEVQFIDIPSSDTNAIATPPDLAQTTGYRLIALSSHCGTDTSAVIKIYVFPPPVGAFTYTVNGNDVTFNSTSSSQNVAYNWDFGDGNTSALANPVNHYATKDTFNVCLTVYNGTNCSFTICKNVDVLDAGVNAVTEGDNALKIYPNPVSDGLLVVSCPLLDKSDINILDVLGKNVLTESVTTDKTTINVSSLTAGVYFVHIHTGDINEVRKFVKQ